MNDVPEYLMIITCKETDENIHEIYGDDVHELKREFEEDFGELYCMYEIFINAVD